MGKDIQMEIEFEKRENSFRKLLDSGSFNILLEHEVPSKESDNDVSGAILRKIEHAAIHNGSVPAALALVDKVSVGESRSIADFADFLSKENRNRHVLYLSGKNKSLPEIRDNIERCRASGFRNLLAVTGEGAAGESRSETRRIPYVDSIHTLTEIRNMGEDYFFPGAVVSPFKYTPSDLYMQYYKLMKKIKTGAGMIVAQAGWDMMKMQELRWFLEMREAPIPVLARIFVLTPDSAAEIIEGKRPGIHISDDFRRMLEQESRYGFQQFAAAQWRRIQIVSAGARLLGYSGVQIHGVEHPEHVMTVCTLIADAVREFAGFEDWKEAYLEHLARADMAPYPNRFYMFEELFRKTYDDKPVKTEIPGLGPKRFEKTVYRLSSALFKDSGRLAPDERYITKRILAACPRCGRCRLQLTQYVCPETCPKRLANGPCGGTKADGSCEFGNRECIHNRRFRIAAWQKELHQLEERYIRPVE